MTEPTQISEVDPVEAARLADAGEVLLLDVRENDEWSKGHAPQATHLTGGMNAWAAAGLPVVRPDGEPGEVT